MNKLCKRIWNQDQGVLTFEWILLITVLVIGIVGGLSAVRDGIIDELGDVVGAMVNVDQSYTVEASPCPGDQPLVNSFGFEDTVPTCPSGGTPGRQRSESPGQGDVQDCQGPNG